MFGSKEGFAHSLLFVLLDCKWWISTVNQDGFKPNLETHLIPLLATKMENASRENKDKNNTSSTQGSHHSLLMQVANLYAELK